MAHLVFLAHPESRGQSVRDNEHYQRAAHSIDTTLHSLSDTQLVASIGLLFATLYQSCDISAYHYNLVCCMLLMSMATHIFAFVKIPHLFKRTSSRHSSDYLVSSLLLFSLGFCAKTATFRDFQWT
ncbi:hypothetical protein V2W45_603811 [Cenococcum geophilum]